METIASIEELRQLLLLPDPDLRVYSTASVTCVRASARGHSQVVVPIPVFVEAKRRRWLAGVTNGGFTSQHEFFLTARGVRGE